MGIDIHVRIIIKNRNKNIWEEVKLYYKENNDFKAVKVYPYRDYELFDILNHKTNDYFLKTQPILDVDLPETLKKEIEECRNSLGYYGFREINLADLKLYLHHKPKIRDWDYEEDEPNAMTDNPVKYFIEQIEQYISFASFIYDFAPPSDVKIIYWFDH